MKPQQVKRAGKQQQFLLGPGPPDAPNDGPCRAPPRSRAKLTTVKTGTSTLQGFCPPHLCPAWVLRKCYLKIEAGHNGELIFSPVIWLCAAQSLITVPGRKKRAVLQCRPSAARRRAAGRGRKAGAGAWLQEDRDLGGLAATAALRQVRASVPSDCMPRTAMIYSTNSVSSFISALWKVKTFLHAGGRVCQGLPA